MQRESAERAGNLDVFIKGIARTNCMEATLASPSFSGERERDTKAENYERITGDGGGKKSFSKCIPLRCKATQNTGEERKEKRRTRREDLLV